VDPSYFRTRQLSEKSDVFNFGVVMLELITGRRAYERGKCTYLVEEVKTAINQCDQEYNGLRDMIDPKIVKQVTIIGFRRFVQWALACLEESASDRPFMYQVMKEIEIILQN
jgi:Protein tyrosine and serine/threonine kinase